MVRPRIGPIERLVDAVSERRSLWVLCKGCGHAARLDPRHLIALAGDATLRAVQGKFRCRRCRKKQAALVVGDEAWPGRD